jgi:TonB family protein
LRVSTCCRPWRAKPVTRTRRTRISRRASGPGSNCKYHYKEACLSDFINQGGIIIRPENKRLVISFILAFLFHAAFIIILVLFLVSAGNALPKNSDQTLIELDSSVAPQAIMPSALENDSPGRSDTGVTKSERAADSGTAVNTAKSGAETENPEKTNTAVVKKDESRSLLEEGSLSRLDEALKKGDHGANTNGSGPESASESQSGSPLSASWDDNASREPLSRVSPVIPQWVSEQGLRLKVVLSVELNADGLVIVKGVLTSSGYADVDAAVTMAVSRWKYSRSPVSKTVGGAITYFIEPR